MYPYGTQPFYNGQITRVNGENGARAFQMLPNSSAILLDENDPFIWLCITDGAGYKTVKAYKITEYVPEPQPDISMIMSRLEKIEEMINNGKSNNSETQWKQQDTESGTAGTRDNAKR